MTYNEETELLQLTRENNALLKTILRQMNQDNTWDFFANIAANVIGNRIDGGSSYGGYKQV